MWQLTSHYKVVNSCRISHILKPGCASRVLHNQPVPPLALTAQTYSYSVRRNGIRTSSGVGVTGRGVVLQTGSDACDPGLLETARQGFSPVIRGHARTYGGETTSFSGRAAETQTPNKLITHTRLAALLAWNKGAVSVRYTIMQDRVGRLAANIDSVERLIFHVGCCQSVDYTL